MNGRVNRRDSLGEEHSGYNRKRQDSQSKNNAGSRKSPTAAKPINHLLTLPPHDGTGTRTDSTQRQRFIADGACLTRRKNRPNYSTMQLDLRTNSSLVKMESGGVFWMASRLHASFLGKLS